MSTRLVALSAALSLASSCAESASLERSERFRRQREAEASTSSAACGAEPVGGNVVPCPCGGNFESNGVVLRVTLLGRSSSASITTRFPWCGPNPRLDHAGLDGAPPVCERVRLRVEEVLAGDAQLLPGEEIAADSDGYLPCFRGVAALTIGEQALAFASWEPSPLPACEARERCGDACDAGIEALCPPRPEPTAAELGERWAVRLSPWRESIVFAEVGEAQLSVPASELSVLWTAPEQCLQRFGNWSDLPCAFPHGSSGI